MFTKVLVPVDASEASDRTIQEIIAKKDDLDGAITLLHVINIDSLAYRMIPELQVEMIREPAKKAGESVLAKHQNTLNDSGIDTLTRLEFGSPRKVIPDIANDEEFNLLVIARRGTGEIRDVLFGSVANFVLHNVNCPVLLF